MNVICSKNLGILTMTLGFGSCLCFPRRSQYPDSHHDVITSDYSDYLDHHGIHRHLHSPMSDVLISYRSFDSTIFSIKRELENKHFVVNLKEYGSQESGPSWENSKLHVAIISDDDEVFLNEMSLVLKDKTKSFVPVFYKGLQCKRNPKFKEMVDRWDEISGRFQMNTFKGNEDDVLELAKVVVGLLVEQLFYGLLHFQKEIRIHYHQCNVLVQKLLAAEAILTHIINSYFEQVNFAVFKHVLVLSEHGKVLLHSCTSAHWLTTALFRQENVEEYQAVITELEDYCVLLVAIVPHAVNDPRLKEFQDSLLSRPIPSLKLCAERDQKCFADDLAHRKAQDNELPLIQFLLNRLNGNEAEAHKDLQMASRNPEILGKGAYGKVYQCKWNGVTLAVKRSNALLTNEMKLMKASRHPNVVSVVASYDEHSIAMERLKPFKPFMSQPKLPLNTRIDIMLQIARVMRWLHEQDIIYRDLKPDNILINCDDLRCKHIHVKLGDFGTAKDKFSTSATLGQTKGIGTFWYMAPEVVSRNDGFQYSRKADVFSYGKTCYNILAGSKGIVNDLEPFDYVPKCLASYLKTCIAESEEARPHFKHICEVLQLMKKADLLGITTDVDRAFAKYSAGNFSIDNDPEFKNLSPLEMNIVCGAARAMVKGDKGVEESAAEEFGTSSNQHIKELKGWLVVDKSLTPKLFDKIEKSKLLDGTEFLLKSIKHGKYVSVNESQHLIVNKVLESDAQKFKLWRCAKDRFHIRVFKFLNSWELDVPKVEGQWIRVGETYDIIMDPKGAEAETIRVRIKTLATNRFLQVDDADSIVKCINYVEPGWNDNDCSVFEMHILKRLGGEYQLVNGINDHNAASTLMQAHWNSYYTEMDFRHWAKQEHVRILQIPVGWWMKDSPAPFVEGSVQFLDRAFAWANQYEMKIILSLQASSGYRDGDDGPDIIMRNAHMIDYNFHFVPINTDIRPLQFLGYSHGVGPRAHTLDTMNFLAKRYGKNSALLRMQLVPGLPNEEGYEELEFRIASRTEIQ